MRIGGLLSLCRFGAERLSGFPQPNGIGGSLLSKVAHFSSAGRGFESRRVRLLNAGVREILPMRETAARQSSRESLAKEFFMSLILLIVLVFLCIALLPMWDYNAQWGYVPGGSAGVLIVILTLLLIVGRLG